MSSDPPKKTNKRQRVDSGDFGGRHELEQKRNRGEIACKECRRLKIKCDKKIPCQSCLRRGCTKLCPNGSLATGQGTRFVLAATEHLHHRIARMSDRIRQLEEALGQASNFPHPLLHEELCNDLEDDEGGFTGNTHESNSNDEIVHALGTLSISGHGISRFFGPTGGSESLLLSNNTTPVSSAATSPVSVDLDVFSAAFPLNPLVSLPDIRPHLPPLPRATKLCQTFFSELGWLFRGVCSAQIIGNSTDEKGLFNLIYQEAPRSDGLELEEDEVGPHDLALLFVILALGALVLGKDADHSTYHNVARAALGMQSVLEKPSVSTIQSLHLLSIYNAMTVSDKQGGMETTWSMVTLASHLSMTAGLHRDSARWGLIPLLAERRRVVFWDLFIADVWHSMNTGRPPSFSLPYIDCNLPAFDLNDEFEVFENWQIRFAVECVYEVTSRTLVIEPPNYAVTMELDKKVRDFAVPEVSTDEDDTQDPGLILARSFVKFVLGHIKETVLMYVHRGYFAVTLTSHPSNPLKSPYASSFLATYNASSTILKYVSMQFRRYPKECGRMWMMWGFAFGAGVVFGTIVCNAPHCPMATTALTELEKAIILFEEAKGFSNRAAVALPVLRNLAQKAKAALKAPVVPDSTWASSDQPGKREDGDDELSIMAGHTRLLVDQRRNIAVSAEENSETVYAQPTPQWNNTYNSQPYPFSESYDRFRSNDFVNEYTWPQMQQQQYIPSQYSPPYGQFPAAANFS